MAHAVKISRVDQKEQAKSISNLESQKLSLRFRVNILCVSRHVKRLKRCKTHRPLLLVVGTPGEANIFCRRACAMMESSRTASSSLRTEP